MLRRTLQRFDMGGINATALHGINFYSPTVIMPDHYWQRVANQKEVHLSDRRDPKNYHGKRNKEFYAQVHPSIWGLDRHNHANFDNKGGIMCDVPPVPVYREMIWCIGHHSYKCFHPRIHIKVPLGKVVGCKWCRTKFINMATDEDNDEDWEKVYLEINTTPESKKDLMRPFRNPMGVYYPGDTNFPPEYGGPHPYVYRTVFDPMKNYYNKYGIEPPAHVKARIEEEKDVPIEDAWKRHWRKKLERMEKVKDPEQRRKIAEY